MLQHFLSMVQLVSHILLPNLSSSTLFFNSSELFSSDIHIIAPDLYTHEIHIVAPDLHTNEIHIIAPNYLTKIPCILSLNLDSLCFRNFDSSFPFWTSFSLCKLQKLLPGFQFSFFF